MWGLLTVASLFLGVLGKSDVETITSHGYPAEEYNVTTDDGYILSLQRIPYGKNSSNSTRGRKVVFLMHGALTGSNAFIYLGPEYAIAYNLADAEYDVWMGNARGNAYSRRHVTLDPDTDKFQFFNFTYEEIALYDLPAMIDFVLLTTEVDALHLIAFSEGASALNVLNSMNTEYQSKITSAHLLAGLGYEKHFPNKAVKSISSYVDIVSNLAELTGYVEMKPNSTLTTLVTEFLVNSTIPDGIIVGTSLKHAIHVLQNIRDESFSRYNYGTVKNLFKYGRLSPPAYDLSKIQVNVTFHYSVGDATQSEKDVLAMVEVMPNAVAHKITRDDFVHMDYVISPAVKDLVTVYMIEAFKDS